MKKAAVYFFGLVILTSGIFILNAQDDTQPSDNAQPAAQSSAVEESAEANGEVEAVQKPSRGVSPVVSNQETSVTESPAVSVETNVTAMPAPGEAKPEQPEAESSAESKNGKEETKEEKAPDFEIDRAGAAGKGIDEKKTGKTSAAVKKSAAEEKPAVEEKTVAAEKEPEPTAVEKSKGKGWFRGLFGSGKEQKQKETEQHPVAGAVASKNLTPEELLAVQEEVRRQAKEIEGLKKLDQACQEMSRNEFEKALKSFQEALSAMPVRPHTVETRQKAMRSEADCAYRLALKSYLEGNFKGAQDGINRALEFYPAHRASARLSERIRQDETRRAQIASKPISPKMSPVYQDKQKKIGADLQSGREYMAIKEYDSAEGEFKSVLIDDKLNPEASANLKKIAETRYLLETDEFQRMKAEMLAQIRDTWTPPIKKILTGPKGETAETIITSQARRRLLEKLNNITIEKIDFRNANIMDVVGYLHQQSVVSDRDQTPGEKGVNFFLNLRRPGEKAGSAAPAAPPAESADIFAAEGGSPAEGNAGVGSIPSITLTLTRISLMQALKYITEFGGLKYRIEDNVVVIFPADVAYGELETRTYKIQPSIVETFMGTGTGQAAAESDKLELGGGGLGTGTTTERKDMKQFFSNAGVPFPAGTSIVYIPGQTLLIVKNTSENLENFERLLNKLNVPTMLIEIEARFVEIGQNDLQEIGLEWLLTDNWELAEKQSGLPPSMRERLQMNRNNITKGLRELNVAGGQVVPGVSGTMGSIVSISSILTNPELTVILHALEQQDGVNLLSAPKVTTKSGASAEIKVVKELIYPTEYQQQAQSIGTTSAGNQSLVQIVVTPSAFETRDTGVILQVTPTVGPDNETIDLAMVPQVVELAEWIDYGSDVPTGDPNRTQHLTLNQPIFHSRSITTSISIWDGQTVVMGGLITEGQRNTEDKIPLLGDIPLLGYLFRTKTTQSIKKNLLIFVTANLVDPAGNKFKKETAPPLPADAGGDSATP